MSKALSSAKPTATKKSSPKKSSPARAAPAKKKSGSSTSAPALNKTAEVDAFMRTLDHPFKREVQLVREIIKSVNPNITEEIKWSAPTFSYKGYIVTFNLWAKDKVHLVFHNGAILNDKNKIMEGDYPDRRMVYFRSMSEIKSKKAALQDLIKQWVNLKDSQV
jgi:hypothetical protein